MSCLFCGHGLGPTALVTGDSDFCSPVHRRQFHDRLRRVLEQLADPPAACFSTGPFIGGRVQELDAIDHPYGAPHATWMGPCPRLPGLTLAIERMEKSGRADAPPAADRTAATSEAARLRSELVAIVRNRASSETVPVRMLRAGAV